MMDVINAVGTATDEIVFIWKEACIIVVVNGNGCGIYCC